jgi:hypothetical protein
LGDLLFFGGRGLREREFTLSLTSYFGRDEFYAIQDAIDVSRR